MSLKLAGIDFGSLLPEAVAKVKEAAGKELSGAAKEAWVVKQLETALEALLDQALPMFRPIIRPVLEFAVPFAVKAIWTALFGAKA